MAVVPSTLVALVQEALCTNTQHTTYPRLTLSGRHINITSLDFLVLELPSKQCMSTKSTLYLSIINFNFVC